MASSTLEYARACLSALHRDLPLLEHLDSYSQGRQAGPYIPDKADGEFRMLAERCVTNISEFAIGTVVEPIQVDSFRPASAEYEATAEAAWRHWQRSRLQAGQSVIYRGAGTFGHAFTITERHPKRGVVTRGLSPLRTTAIYENPAWDDDPLAAITVTKWPVRAKTEVQRPAEKGEATLWDETHVWDVTFESLTDVKSVHVSNGRRHGLERCPVTRFAIMVDLEGRTTGLLEPMLVLQDRLNQQSFDLLLNGTYSSYQVRTVTGMTPPVKQKPIKDPITEKTVGFEPELDDNGRPMPDDVKISSRRLLMAQAPDAKFGSLPGTPPDGFISSIELTLREIAGLGRIPPHHLLGQIANLSADALRSAERALMQKVGEIKENFAESWERVFRLAAELDGEIVDQDNVVGEVVWRDVSGQALAQAGDALGKFASELDVPRIGLWERIPGVTKEELERWRDLREEEDEEMRMREALERASQTTSERPSFREEPAEGGAGEEGS